MNKQDIEVLYDYNRWANAEMLGAVSKLTAEQFAKDLSSSFPSVRDTLAHILGAEWIWLMRWKGVSPTTGLTEFPGFDSLKVTWAEVEREQSEFLKGLSDEAVSSVISYTNVKGERYAYPLWQMMQHVANHSTYHRGQVTTMLRQLGAEAVTTDFLNYIYVKATPPDEQTK